MLEDAKEREKFSMKIESKFMFDPEDIRLLRNPLPENPCSSCNRNNCSGCEDADTYQKVIQIYKDRRILEIAMLLKNQRLIHQQLKSLTEMFMKKNSMKYR